MQADSHNTRRIFVLTATLSVFLSLFWQSGCKKDESPTGPSSAALPVSVNEQQRAAALKGVETVLSSVSNQSMSAGNTALVAYLRSQSDFTAAGIADTGGNVWARFTDGRLLIIANNRPVAEDTSSPLPLISHSNNLNKSVGENMPLSMNARVMNAMGTWFTDPTGVLSGILSSKGYKVTSEIGTVDNLIKVSGDGIFYFDTHGGNGWRRDSTSIIALWTATPRTPQLDVTYKGMLDIDELCYFTAKNNLVTYDSATIETHYGITDKFVLSHMSFGRDCLIYIDACRSFVNNFITPFISKSANYSGTFISWSNYVDDHKAYKVMKFVFDRLLGTNIKYVPWVEDPPQRPFGIEKVWTDMGARTPPVNRYTDNSGPGNAQIATLLYQIGGGSVFSILAPSIKFLTVDEGAQFLYLDGIFGDDPGDVTVDGVSLVTYTWDNSSVVCYIPKSGKGSAGDVIVTVRDHKSNVVQLTEWRGTITFNQPSLGTMGTFYKFDLHFRADVHSFREKPHETPKATIETDVGFMDDSKGAFHIAGNASLDCPPSGGCTSQFYEIWTPSDLSLGLLSGTAPTGGFTGVVGFTPQDKKVTIIIFGGPGPGLKSSVEATTACGSSSETTNTDYTDDGDATVVPPLGFLQMTMNDSYAIRTGYLDVSHTPRGHIPSMCGSQPANVTATISWSDFLPKFPPADTAARKIAIK